MDKIVEVCHKSGAQVGLVLLFRVTILMILRDLLGRPSRVGWCSSHSGVILTKQICVGMVSSARTPSLPNGSQRKALCLLGLRRVPSFPWVPRGQYMSLTAISNVMIEETRQ